MRQLRYGSLDEEIYPPPTQPIADGLIAANDVWDEQLEECRGMAWTSKYDSHSIGIVVQ